MSRRPLRDGQAVSLCKSAKTTPLLHLISNVDDRGYEGLRFAGEMAGQGLRDCTPRYVARLAECERDAIEREDVLLYLFYTVNQTIWTITIFRVV
jgi:hypothetical protein